MSNTPFSLNEAKAGTHAIVVGGSMAGLLAARVLTDHFKTVTLIERDAFPAGIDNRKGVPQGRHFHALHVRGLEIMAGYFPGLVAALREGGALTLDIPADARWHHFGGYKVHFRSGINLLVQSRPLLEWQLRKRVLALQNLRSLQECDATGLVTSGDRTRVTGIKIIGRTQTLGAQELLADLVVDATGRGSQSPKWLEAIGYAGPEETTVKVGMGYTSRIFHCAPEDLRGAKGLYVLPTPPKGKRFGALFPMEDDRWMATLGGWLGDHAPADERGFLDFAHSLPAPDIYDAIKNAAPLTDAVVHNFPANRWRRYEKLARFPEGYIVLGDAMCSFNPVYGQGMTVSALEAQVLDACLRPSQRRPDDLNGLPRRFFQTAAKEIKTPWRLATGEDFRYPGVEGTRPPGTRFINWYVSRVHQVSTRDREVYRAFLKVLTMTDPPTILFDQRIALRVLFGGMPRAQHQPQHALAR